MNCPVHIQPCDCRELKISTLRQAAIDAAIELDWTKNADMVKDEHRDRCIRIVERVFAACEALDVIQEAIAA